MTREVSFLSFETRMQKRRAEYDAAIKEVLDSGNFILGSSVKTFEQSFSTFMRGGEAVGVGNGTDALEIAISSLGISDGSKIATVANAGAYSSVAILKNHMRPHYMDVDIESRNVAFSEVERVVKEGAKAIILTHLYGNVISEVENIVELCKKLSIPVIEDASQAHGAKLNNVYAGRFGDLGVYSLYPSKNLGALGDAGVVLVNNPKFLDPVTKLRTYGWSDKYDITIPKGRNSRLDELQAAFLSVNLNYLSGDNSSRIEIAKNYSKNILNSNIVVSEVNLVSHVYHLYTILSDKRDELIRHLARNGIAALIHFPIPDYAQSGISSEGISLPNTEYLCQRIISIPCYPELSKDDQVRVCEVLNAF